MSFTNPPTSFIQNYGSSVLMMAQQRESRLRNVVMNETATGERFYFELYNQNPQMAQVTNRFGDIVVNDTAFERRAVDLLDYDFAQFVDSFDKSKMLIDPANPISMAQAAQVGRQIDRIIINAAYADMLTGKTGSVASALPAGQVVAVNSWAYGSGTGNANLTISKLIEAGSIMDNNDVPMEDRYVVLDPVNHSKLLATAEATSADFVTSRNLVTGEIDGLVGFKFIKSTLIPQDGSNFRRVFAFQRTGMGLAVGINPMFDVSIRKDKRSQPVQAYIMMSMAATRLENTKVVEIKCLTT
jgi:hypothetical protein